MVDKMKVAELRTELRRRGLREEGKKAELRERLKMAIAFDKEKANDDEVANHDAQDDDDNDDEEDEAIDEVEEDEAEEDEVDQDEAEYEMRSRTKRRSRADYIPTYKDVEESLELFSGDKSTNVRRWIEEFEDTANLCDWTDIQKVIYAKRLLRGSAKLFVNFEKCAKTWKMLKTALISEFEKKVNSHKVHRELSERKKKNSETYEEYVYTMLAIAADVSIDTDAVIQYIIDGIPDVEVNKAILYGATSIKELKSKIRAYENMKRNMKTTPRHEERKQKDGGIRREVTAVKTEEEKRCFNCGGRDHVNSNCPTKEKGKKCFNCNDYGHISAACPKKNETKRSCNATQHESKKYSKDVWINDCKLSALIDTGSDISLIRAEDYVRVGAPVLTGKKINFHGIGSDENLTLGSVTVAVIIDGDTFDATLHVVSDGLIKQGILLGADFLRDLTVTLKSEKITIAKREDALPTIFKIDVVQLNEFNETNVSSIDDPKLRDEVKNLIDKYQPCRIREADVKMRIILTDETPIAQRPRRLSPSEKEEVDTQISMWLKEGIIRPSTSEFASPVVLAKKKDGSTRICVDYRELNRKIIRDRYPLPLIEDRLDQLQKTKIFSTIDLKNGFFHTRIEEDSIKYTAFVVPNGQYEFLRVPFGLCNSPPVFQRYINHIFRELIALGIVAVYMDDLIILASTSAEALENLKKVLCVASEYGLSINWKKCAFLQNSVEYLGHVVRDGSVQPSPGKIQAVKDFKKPTCVKDIQSFLGLAGYFRKFVHGYAEIAKPLTNLLRSGIKFKFEQVEMRAFNQLKSTLMEKPVLKLYNPKAETELHTDASIHGYGAILLQKDSVDGTFHPVYFASGTTTPAETKYCSYELEVLAIVKALKKFRVYLLGIHFKLVTDCKAFVCTMKKKDINVRIARWALCLEEFSYSVEHRSGNKMNHVDALSRYPLPSTMLIEEEFDGLLARIKTAQERDDEIRKMMDEAKRDNSSECEIKNGLLYKRSGSEMLVVIPKSMQESIIRQAHERGHFSADKTEHILRRDYWFPKMKLKVDSVVRNCIHCILIERKQGKQEGFMYPIDKGDRPLDTFHIDHIGPLHTTKKRYRHIFVVIDAFSKFTWLYPVRSTDVAEVLDRLRKQSYIFGNPRRIVSDRGSAFTSNAFDEYCTNEHIEHVLVTTGMARGNGQVERVNRILIPILSKLAAPISDNWYRFVEATQRYINSTPNRSTGFSPFDILFGVRMRLEQDPQLQEIIEKESAILFQRQRDRMREQARETIQKVQTENNRNFDKKRKKPNHYQTGMLVAIKRTQQGPGMKLLPKFLGPYRVTRVLRNDRYVVEKIGEHDGPRNTSTSAEYMKPWINDDSISISDVEM